MNILGNSENNNKIKKIFIVSASVFMTVVLIFVFIFSVNNASDKSYSYNDFAMGANISLTLYNSDINLSDDVMSSIRTLDNAISKNIVGSEVYKLNTANGSQCYAPNTAELIKDIIPIIVYSDYSLNPLCGALTELWDIGGENQRVPSQSEIYTTVTYCNFNDLVISGDNITIKNNNAKLDLGAIGKGAACDAAKEILADTPAVLAVGGSILVNGEKPGGEDWIVGVKDPNKTDKQLCTISIKGTKNISTSGSYEKYFDYDGKRYHHILNTSTGYPFESDIVSVTVLHESGTIADALSTACFTLGVKGSAELLESTGSEAIIVDNQNNVYISKSILDDVTLLNTAEYHSAILS